MMTTSGDVLRAIPKLSRTQREVLIQVALGNDRGHPRTLEALERRGFIRSSKQKLVGGWPPVTVTRYHTPIFVHIAVCDWCSRTCHDEAQ